MALQAKNGDSVRVHYVGRLTSGTVFDSSVESDPLQFQLGEGQLIPGFENAVIGLTAGQSTTTHIPNHEAYGPKQEELIFKVERSTMPEDIEPEIGLELTLQEEDGEPLPVIITALDENFVTFDANHPLSGEDLVFEITLVEIL